MSIVSVIHNPASGGAVDGDDLRAAFDEHADGHRVGWIPTTPDDPGVGQARTAVADGSEVVVAVGGDGTVRAVAESVAGSSAELGIVPLGTGNLLATNLGLAAGLDAVPRALSAPARTLDTAVVNGERFAVMAGVGFDALMIRDAADGTKRRVGSIAYVVSGVRHVPARLVRARVRVDGDEVFRGRTAMILVGNCGRVTGGLEVFPDAEPDDGLLDVAVLTATRLRDWVTIAHRLVRGRPQPDDLVRRYRGAEVDVELDEPVAYELDGEDRDPTDQLRFEVEPGSLKVRC